MTTFTTDDRKNAAKKQHWEEAFIDWKELLAAANASSLLKDPAACFDEGWRQATMIAVSLIQSNPDSSILDIITLIERKLLK